MPDMVNHPSHYTAGGVVCIGSNQGGYRLAVHRVSMGQCDEVPVALSAQGKRRTDLMKCKWYIDRLIDEVGGEDER